MNYKKGIMHPNNNDHHNISNAKIFKSGLANSNGNNKRRFYELILAR